MKVLITGASGFLGSHVAEQLSLKGHDVRALVRETSDTKFLATLSSVSLVYGSLEDRDSVLAACEGVDAIVHSASLVKARSTAEFRRVNVQGTRHVLDGAVEHGVGRLVYVGSLTARAPSPNGERLPTDAQPAPVTAYGRTKLEAERLVLEAKDKLHVTVIRPTAVYGPRDREMYQLFQYATRRILPLIGDPNGKLTMIYGEDCARALIDALTVDIPSGQAFDLDDGNIYTRAQLSEGLEEAVGKRALVRFPIPTAIVRALGVGGDVYRRLANKPVMVTSEKVDELLEQWVGDSSDARDKLGFKASVDWFEGAKRTADWYFANGWL